MFDKMKDLWEMKKKVEEIKSELDGLVLTSEDEWVKVSITGSQEIKSVTIKKNLADASKKELEDSLVETINRAVKQSQKTAAEKMGGLDFQLPQA